MQDELITPDNLSNDFLLPILDAAYLEPGIDDDGDLFFQDSFRSYITYSKKNDAIQLETLFTCKPESTMAERLECANKINRHFLLVKAVATENERINLNLSCEICIAGGINKKNFILTVKRFIRVVASAVQEHMQDILK